MSSDYNKNYYQSNKQSWKNKYNNSEYHTKTRNLIRKKYVYVLDIPNTDMKIQFKSKKQLLDLIRKENFDFFNQDSNNLLIGF